MIVIVVPGVCSTSSGACLSSRYIVIEPIFITLSLSLVYSVYVLRPGFMSLSGIVCFAVLFVLSYELIFPLSISPYLIPSVGYVLVASVIFTSTENGLVFI